MNIYDVNQKSVMIYTYVCCNCTALWVNTKSSTDIVAAVRPRLVGHIRYANGYLLQLS